MGGLYIFGLSDQRVIRAMDDQSTSIYWLPQIDMFGSSNKNIGPRCSNQYMSQLFLPNSNQYMWFTPQGRLLWPLTLLIIIYFHALLPSSNSHFISINRTRLQCIIIWWISTWQYCSGFTRETESNVAFVHPVFTIAVFVRVCLVHVISRRLFFTHISHFIMFPLWQHYTNASGKLRDQASYNIVIAGLTSLARSVSFLLK